MRGSVSVDEKGIRIDGEYRVLLCSSLFYFRLPRKTWEKRILDLKWTGYNCVDVYFPWNYHEIREGAFDYAGERDCDAFLQLLAKHGMYVVARPGPYICSEWDGGGLPSRICSNYDLRQNDEAYLEQVEKWYDSILPVIAKRQIGRGGGSVILMQLENELDFFGCRDVTGMIARLRDSARRNGIEVPLFCCAGQGDAVRAGGFTPGVLPTYNFYPSSTDAEFDGVCRRYAQALAKKGLPLLVTETGREHSLLKRELLAGAKLLGAYNQVAGSNFEYYQSVNNWGDPLSLITTRYDFGSMITTLGDYNREADEAVLFSGLIASLGAGLAGAELAEGCPLEVTSDFLMPSARNTLRLAGGGYLVGLSNLSDRTGTASVSYRSGVDVSVGAGITLALPYGVELGGFELCFSNYEIFSTADGLTMAGEGRPYLHIKKDGVETELTADGEFCGLAIRFLTRAQAVSEYIERTGHRVAYADQHCVEPVASCKVCAFSTPGTFLSATSPRLIDNGISYGAEEIMVQGTPGKALLLEHVSDFMTVCGEGGKLYGGECVTLPAREDGKYLLRVEKWGHSNFDDPRRRSMYIKSFRGIEEIYSVESVRPLNVWRFRTYGEWRPERLTYQPGDFDPQLSVNSWNSASLPLVCLYYARIKRPDSGKLMLEIQGGAAEVCVYVDGDYYGEFHIHDKHLDITRAFAKKAEATVELLVRKREWTQPVGSVSLLGLGRAAYEIRPLTAAQIAAFRPQKLSVRSFPLEVKAGETFAATVDLEKYRDRDCYGVVTGSGYKLTAVCAGRVIARMVAPDEAINQQGGSDTQFYLPACFDKTEILLLVEGLKDGELSFAIEYNPNFN